ncbi:hypothetical protein SGLAM104S_05592 [Streptomyces glaucescens]
MPTLSRRSPTSAWSRPPPRSRASTCGPSRTTIRCSGSAPSDWPSARSPPDPWPRAPSAERRAPTSACSSGPTPRGETSLRSLWASTPPRPPVTPTMRRRVRTRNRRGSSRRTGRHAPRRPSASCAPPSWATRCSAQELGRGRRACRPSRVRHPSLRVRPALPRLGRRTRRHPRGRAAVRLRCRLPSAVARPRRSARPRRAPRGSHPVRTGHGSGSATTGNPGWDPYDDERRATMRIGTEWTQSDDPRSQERQAWH